MDQSLKNTREEYMFSLVKSSMESSISNKDFCKQHNIAYAVFYYWKKKYLESITDTQNGFLQLQGVSCVLPEVAICYPNGTIVKLSQGFDLTVIRNLIGLV